VDCEVVTAMIGGQTQDEKLAGVPLMVREISAGGHKIFCSRLAHIDQ
jgi:hypothetical protein